MGKGISQLAHIDPSAKIGNDVIIHAFAYIDADVEIGDGCEIMPYASMTPVSAKTQKSTNMPSSGQTLRTSAGREKKVCVSSETTA